MFLFNGFLWWLVCRGLFLLFGFGESSWIGKNLFLLSLFFNLGNFFFNYVFFVEWDLIGDCGGIFRIVIWKNGIWV